MKKNILHVLNLLGECIEEDGGILDLAWCTDLLYPFYKHFNDEDLLVRLGSLIGFWGLLLEWEDGSGQPFYTGSEEYDCHHIDYYFSEFLKHYQSVKKVSPHISEVIIEAIYKLDMRVCLEDEFPHIDTELFSEVRELVKNEYHRLNEGTYFKAIDEAGFKVR